MRLVKLELRDAPFWFLSNTSGTVLVALDRSKPVSNIFDADDLEDHFLNVINSSASHFEIEIIDSQNRKLRSLNDAIFVDGDYSVDLEDVVNLDASDFPEIVSVTINEEDEEEEEEIVLSPTPEMIESAKILLERNGNTVKKTLRALQKTDSNLVFLRVCMESEYKGQNRHGVILAIQTMITEYKDE